MTELPSARIGWISTRAPQENETFKKGREMYILATGMNPADANVLKRSPRVEIFQAFGEMIRYLQDVGENVDWRRMRVGGPIPPGVDAIVVSLMLPRSLNCPYALGVIWTISEALRLEIPLVLYMCDWAFFRAHPEFRSIAKAGTSYFFKKIGNAPQYDESPMAIEEYGDQLIEVCEAYGNPSSRLWRNAQVMVPRYTHIGDVRIVQRLLPGVDRVFTMDPTPLFLRYLDSGLTPSAEDQKWTESRAQRWILPSLLIDDDWIDRQELTWPVDRFGPKGCIVLENEREVTKAYARRAGALCPPYPTAGSGWWRSRWIHAARARLVLLCDSTDDQMFDSSIYAYNGEEYERMSATKRMEVAEEQAKTLERYLQKDLAVFQEQVYAPFGSAFG